jgi:hypothetical protein
MHLLHKRSMASSGQPVHVQVVVSGPARNMLSVARKYDEDMFQKFEGLNVDVLSDDDEWYVVIIPLLFAPAGENERFCQSREGCE